MAPEKSWKGYPRSVVKTQSGATLVELVYVIPLFFALVCAIFETAYAYRLRATLNVATFQAARAGAMNNAHADIMRDRLARSMAPEYTRGDASAVGLGRAYLSAQAVARTLSAVRNPVRIVSPNRQIFNRFRVRRRVQLEGQNRPRAQWIIPNDNLIWRDHSPRQARIDGRNRDITIQDANLLKIRTFWCYKLKTPVFDRIVWSTVSGFFGTPEQRACNAVGVINGGYYLPITSQAIVRMQSHVSNRDLR